MGSVASRQTRVGLEYDGDKLRPSGGKALPNAANRIAKGYRDPLAEKTAEVSMSRYLRLGFLDEMMKTAQYPPNHDVQYDIKPDEGGKALQLGQFRPERAEEETKSKGVPDQRPLVGHVPTEEKGETFVARAKKMIARKQDSVGPVMKSPSVKLTLPAGAPKLKAPQFPSK